MIETFHRYFGATTNTLRESASLLIYSSLSCGPRTLPLACHTFCTSLLLDFGGCYPWRSCVQVDCQPVFSVFELPTECALLSYDNMTPNCGQTHIFKYSGQCVCAVLMATLSVSWQCFGIVCVCVLFVLYTLSQVLGLLAIVRVSWVKISR